MLQIEAAKIVQIKNTGFVTKFKLIFSLRKRSDRME